MININNPELTGGTSYWHRGEHVAEGSNEHRGWTYIFKNGAIGSTSQLTNTMVWLVRDGDVAAPKEYNSRVEGGTNHTLILKENGELWGWGLNSWKQLGINLPSKSTSPMLLDHNNNYAAISAGHDHSLAIKDDGSLVGWCATANGKLGNQASSFLTTPTDMGLTNIKQIEAGYYHSMALKHDGTVWAWGKHDKGQLGHKQAAIAKTPSQVSGLANIKHIESGLNSSYALATDGQIWSWGHNSYGQLGRTTQNNEHIPALVDGLDNVKTLAAGFNHALALKNDGSVWSFGTNTSYQTGHYQRLYVQKVPYKIPSLSGIVSVAAGYNYSVALKADGTVWTWGGNSYGQLGLGYKNTTETTPLQVPNINNAVAIEAHHTTTFVLLKTGELLAFGRNSASSIGNGSNQDVTTPVEVLSDVLN